MYYNDAVQKYLKMGILQLRWDYLQEYDVKKQEHLEDKSKCGQNKGVFNFKTTESDATTKNHPTKYHSRTLFLTK